MDSTSSEQPQSTLNVTSLQSQAGSANSAAEESIILSDQYLRGETDVKKTVAEMLALEMKGLLFKFGAYLLTTVAGVVIATIWTMNAKLSELEGKYSSPDKMLEIMGERLNKLEEHNQMLMKQNYALEVQKIKLELTLKNKKK